MEPLRHHQIDFVLPATSRATITTWLKHLKPFLAHIHEPLQPVTQGNTLESGLAPATEFSLSQSDSFHIEDVLESLAVQQTVQLITALGHHQSALRIKAASFLFQLASILDDKNAPSENKLAPVINSFNDDNTGIFLEF